MEGIVMQHLTEEEKQLAKFVEDADCGWPDRLYLLNKTEALLKTINDLRAERVVRVVEVEVHGEAPTIKRV